jgi:hypothetical protein
LFSRFAVLKWFSHKTFILNKKLLELFPLEKNGYITSIYNRKKILAKFEPASDKKNLPACCLFPPVLLCSLGDGLGGAVFLKKKIIYAKNVFIKNQ